MDSYTLGSDLMVTAMESKLAESGDTHYEMRLNHSDFSTLIRALASISGGVQLDDDETDAALMMLSDIGSTLGVEGI